MTNQTFDEQLREIILDIQSEEAGNTIGSMMGGRNEAALDTDYLPQIKAAIREHMPPKRTRSNDMKDTVSAALLHTLDEKEYNTAIDDVERGLGL